MWNIVADDFSLQQREGIGAYMKKPTRRAQTKKRRYRLMFALVGCIVLVLWVGVVLPTNDKVFIVSMTETAKARQMPIEPDDNFLTYTEFIEQVTETKEAIVNATAGIATLRPTLTPLPLKKLQEKWLQKLEGAIGFSHSSLDQVVQELLDVYQDDLVMANRAFLNVDSKMYRDEEMRYVAVMIQATGYRSTDTILLIFDVENEIPRLKDKRVLALGNWVLAGESEFADFNNSGYPNLAFASFEEYNDCSISKITILEFTPDGMIDISPIYDEQPIQNVSDFRMEDTNADGVLEILDPSPRVIIKGKSERCPRSRIPVYFEWNGERYAKVDD